MTDIAFSCACGKAQLLATNVTPQNGTRIICYCKDCQAFAHFLERSDTVLDAWGGSEIFQMPLAYVQVTQGIKELRCMRLSEKGLYRWFTGCCNTPIGNTMGANMPFIGLIHSALEDTSVRDANLGPIRGYVQVNSASAKLAGKENQADVPLPLLLRIFSKLLVWKLKGLNKPSSFFDSEGQPVVVPFILETKNENVS
jgi:hypothetical protein